MPRNSLTKSLAAITALAAAVWSGAVLAQTVQAPQSGHYIGPGHGMYWGDHMGGYGWILGPLVMIVVIVPIIAVVRSMLVPHASEPSRDGAIEILKARFARGEIDEQEFDLRKSILLK